MRRLLLSALPAVLVLLAAPACDRLSIGSGKTYKRQTEKKDLDCDMSEGLRPRDGCVTGTLTCGSSVEGNTAGGRNNWSDDFYNAKYCMPFSNHYDGPERIYTFEMKAGSTANLWLDSDCVDLDLFAVRWNYEGRCPGVSHTISECEVDESKKGGMIHLETTTRPAKFLIGVDGKGGATGPFRITAECTGR